MIIDIEQVIINHSTFSTVVQYVGHVHTSLCGHAPRDQQRKIFDLF